MILFLIYHNGNTSLPLLPISLQSPIQSPPYRKPRKLIQILLRQPKLLIIQTPRPRMITRPIRKKRPRIQRNAHPLITPLLNHFIRPRKPFLRPLMPNLPIFLLRPRHPQDRIEHIPLTHHKRSQVRKPVPPVIQASTFITLIVPQNFQTQQRRHPAPNLRQSTRSNRLSPLIKQRNLPPLDIKPITIIPTAQRKLIPKTTRDPDPRTHAQFLNQCPISRLVRVNHHVLREVFIGIVLPEFIGEDPGDSGFGGCADEFFLLVWRGADAHGDDEGILILEAGDEGSVVVVIDAGDGNAGRHFRGAGFAGDGGDFECFVLEQGGDDVFAAVAGGL